MPLDATTITAQVKQDAQAWRRDPTSQPSEALRACLVHKLDVEDAFAVMVCRHFNKRREHAGMFTWVIRRLTIEGAGLIVCCLLWDIDDEGRAPTDQEYALAATLVRLVWTPKPVDEVVNVPGAKERWEIEYEHLDGQ